jgi:photosystem II stability/assembly factor-like uncharacterized protein
MLAGGTLLLPLLLLAPASAQFAGGGGAGGDVAKFTKELHQTPAMRVAFPTRADMLGVAPAGNRVVAVGDHGTVLLSDDAGKSWRQAREVPTQALLTSVCFIDATRGWAVGHWGVVLSTQDGGETWKLMRQDVSVDRPLFSVHFMDGNTGIAAGLWSLVLRTTDGGASWTPIEVPVPRGAGKYGPNLYQIFPAQEGRLFIAAEQGYIYRSDDGGLSWSMIETGDRGSLWTGLGLRDGSLLVAGLNGKLLRSADGTSWSDLQSGVGSSITDLAQQPDGTVIGVGLAGAVVDSKDGIHFSAHPRPDRASLTAVLVTAQGHALLFSEDGVIGD